MKDVSPLMPVEGEYRLQFITSDNVGDNHQTHQTGQGNCLSQTETETAGNQQLSEVLNSKGQGNNKVKGSGFFSDNNSGQYE